MLERGRKMAAKNLTKSELEQAIKERGEVIRKLKLSDQTDEVKNQVF